MKILVSDTGIASKIAVGHEKSGFLPFLTERTRRNKMSIPSFCKILHDQV